MKKLLLAAGLLGLVLVGLVSWRASVREAHQAAQAQLERARLAREFDERAALARALPPEAGAAWADEVHALVRAYLAGLGEVRTRFPEAPAASQPGGAAEGGQAEHGGGEAKARQELQAAQAYADERFAPLRDGAYAPLASAVAGGLRLDVLPPQSGASPAGTTQLRVDFALWGAPRVVDREQRTGGTVTRVYTPVTLRTLAVRFLAADGKEFGRMDGPGEPYQKLVDPERFVEEFPPGVLVGTWWLPLLPRDAERVELTLEADVRGASGRGQPATFTVALPVQEGWRTPPGVPDGRSPAAPAAKGR